MAPKGPKMAPREPKWVVLWVALVVVSSVVWVVPVGGFSGVGGSFGVGGFCGVGGSRGVVGEVLRPWGHKNLRVR